MIFVAALKDHKKIKSPQSTSSFTYYAKQYQEAVIYIKEM